MAQRHLDGDGHEPVFLLLATDGLWSMLKDVEVLAVTMESYEDNLQYVVDHLVEQAELKWEQGAVELCSVVDDITVIAVRL